MPRPRRGANIGRRTHNARRVASAIAGESEAEREVRLEQQRERQSRSRSAQTNEERVASNSSDRARMSRNRAVRSRANDNINQRVMRAAFNYDSEVDYCSLPCLSIGTMTNVCEQCNALKFPSETPGMCCANGQVKLPVLNPPPEPLRSLVSGLTPESNHFLSKIQQYNSCFQMTSFGASNIIRDGFMTFKVITEHDTNNEFYREIASNVSCMQIQGQIYHRIGSLLPCLDSNHSFLQIYFMGNSDVEIERRCVVSQNPNDGNAVRRGIIERLQQFFHDENCLIKLFQTALDQMPSDSHRIVIRADKAPGGIHAGRLNAPTIDEVAVLIVDEGASSRDIVLHRRDQSVVHVSETHRCYDALQYPILFWQGEDGYHFNIKMKHRLTG